MELNVLVKTVHMTVINPVPGNDCPRPSLLWVPTAVSWRTEIEVKHLETYSKLPVEINDKNIGWPSIACVYLRAVPGDAGTQVRVWGWSSPTFPFTAAHTGRFPESVPWSSGQGGVQTSVYQSVCWMQEFKLVN